jgi:hypothetical protein
VNIPEDGHDEEQKQLQPGEDEAEVEAGGGEGGVGGNGQLGKVLSRDRRCACRRKSGHFRSGMQTSADEQPTFSGLAINGVGAEVASP